MKQRARRDEDKAERVGAILAAGRELWSRSSWTDFTVGAVAGRAGIVKGTVYLYFPSKERLLLAVFECLLEEYFDDVDRALEKRRGRWSATHVAEVLAKSLRHRDPFLRLLPIVGPFLEHNVDFAAALAFKHLMLRRLSTTARLIEERMPSLTHGDGIAFMQRANALLTGLASTAFPAPVIDRIFHEEPELRVLQVHIDREFSDSITALLQGMEKQK